MTLEQELQVQVVRFRAATARRRGGFYWIGYAQAVADLTGCTTADLKIWIDEMTTEGET